MRGATRSDHGQATVDYVALLGLVAVLLAVGGAAVTVSGVGDRLVYALREGLCVVGGVLCPPPPAPCVVRRDAQRDSGSVTIGVVRLGEDQALVVERLSNGTVAVTLIGGGHAGGEIGIGAGGSIATGGDALGAGAEARAAVIARLGDGREWIVRNEAAARRLIDQLGRDETIPLLDGPAEAIDELFGGGEDVRAPDVEWDEGGTGGDASGEVDVGPGTVSARVAMGVSVGVRTDHRTGLRTYYLRIDATSSTALSAKLVGAGGAGAGATSVAVTFDRHGEPVELLATAFRQLESNLRLPPGLAAGRVLARAAANGAIGGRLEVDARLDLNAPANAEATKRLMDALAHPGDPAELGRAVAGLGERIVNGARLDARVYGTTSNTFGGGARAKVVVGLGATLEHRMEQSTLLGAWERPPDGAWTDRRDCLDAAERLAA
jgi:hypothetical protein